MKATGANKRRDIKRLLFVLLITTATGVTSCATREVRIGRAEMYWLMDRAAYYGDPIGVEMLLKAGADPDGVRDYTAFHKSKYAGLEPSWPLNQAAWGGHVEVVRLLLQAGAKAHAPEGEGHTALTIAAERGHKEVVRLLLEAGADKTYRAPYGQGRVGNAEEIARNSGHADLADMIRHFSRR